jgi:hypothetical protein
MIEGIVTTLLGFAAGALFALSVCLFCWGLACARKRSDNEP